MTNAMQGRTAEMIAVEINVIKGQTRDVILRSAIEIGKRLYEAKAMVPYGRWGEWLKSNVDYSERTAQNLMKCFDEYGQNPQALADVSYSQAVALLGLDGEQRAELMERVDVGELSTRELQAEIAKLREEQRHRQVTLDQLLGEKEEAERLAEEARESAEKLREEKAAAEQSMGRMAQQASDMADRAEKLSRENVALKGEIEKERNRPAPEPETVIQQVETVPEEVRAELDALRKRSAELEDAAKAQRAAERSEAEVLLRDAYRQLNEHFARVRERIQQFEEERPEEAARYRLAVAIAATRMAEQIRQKES